MPTRRPIRFTRSRLRGQALVETAILLPILVLLVLLAIDLGRVYFTSIDMRNAAHEVTMFGGTEPDATCAGDLKAVVDRQMGRTSPEDSICGPMGAAVGRVYITQATCEGGCAPWTPPYDANTNLRYVVRLEYRFQPVMPLVGLLTGNGVGGSIPIRVENRSPILVGYKGG